MREQLANALKNTLNNFKAWGIERLERRRGLYVVTEAAKDTVELKFQIARALRTKDVAKFEEIALREELKRGSREFSTILNSVTKEKKIDISFIPPESVAAVIIDEAGKVRVHQNKITKLKEEINNKEWLAIVYRREPGHWGMSLEESEAEIESLKAEAKELKEQLSTLEGRGAGEFKSYHKNGQLFEHEFYKDGELDGEYRSYYDNGQLKEVGFFKDGLPDGEYRDYHHNGQLAYSGFWKDGEPDGEYRDYHRNGQLMRHEFYKNGKNEGEYKSYHEDGSIFETGSYKDGKLDGEFKSYHDGKVCEHHFYKDGEEISEEEYFQNKKGGIEGEEETINVNITDGRDILDVALDVIIEQQKRQEPVEMDGFEISQDNGNNVYVNNSNNTKIVDKGTRLEIASDMSNEQQAAALLKIAEHKGWDIEKIKPFGNDDFKKQMQQKLEMAKGKKIDDIEASKMQELGAVGGIAVAGAALAISAKNIKNELEQLVAEGFGFAKIEEEKNTTALKEMLNGVDVNQLVNGLEVINQEAGYTKSTAEIEVQHGISQ